MKNPIVFILLFILSSSSFSQSRKKLIKEINHYKNETYKNTKYKTNPNTIKLVLNDYFTSNDYVFQSDNGSSYVFYKKIKLSCRRDGNKKQYGSSYVECYGNQYTTISLINDTDGTIQIEAMSRITNEKQPFSEPFTSQQLIVLGNYNFNKTTFYKYLYNHFNKEALKLSNELIAKIETYNSKQKNKKISYDIFTK